MMNEYVGSVLIIEDDQAVSNLVRSALEKDGLDVVQAFNGKAGLECATRSRLDLCIIDLRLPEMDGWEVFRRLHGDPRFEGVPVIFLTGVTSEADRVAGLELGADDYVTKPFSPRELRARVRAVLRRVRRAAVPKTEIIHGLLSIDIGRCTVRYAEAAVRLTSTEFRILAQLAAEAGRVVSRQRIVATIHGEDSVSAVRAVDAHIKAIRRKLKAGGDQIETVRGFGYRLREATDEH